MKKILVFSVIFMIVLAFMSSIIYATSDDSTVYGSSGSTSPVSSSIDTSVSIGSTAAISQPTLDLSNILSIILVVLGVLMVLFAIAILVRMR